MRLLKPLFESNERWARRKREEDPHFFDTLAKQQHPEYLWIGCADSRVPATQITGTLPGAMFVHRNIANIVDPSDKNCMAVMEYAVDELKVKHILVVGHHRCGGVRGALERRWTGLVDDWIAPIHALYLQHRTRLDAIPDPQERWDRLTELNVLEQARVACNTAIVRQAWARGQELAVHGWVYRVEDGILRDLGFAVDKRHQADEAYRNGVEDILARSATVSAS